mgnify:CR=1
MRLKLNWRSAMDSQRTNTCQAVMQTRRLAGVKAHSPAIAYIADREMGYTDIESGQKMIQDRMRGWG